MDPTVFPTPDEFRPERWLNNDPKLDQYMCSFSKGSRSCIGIQYVLVLSFTLGFISFHLPHDLNCTPSPNAIRSHTCQFVPLF